jgi:hypothetical protein
MRGALAMGMLVSSLFFFRFWRSTRDRLFVFFALAFLMLAMQWTELDVVYDSSEMRHVHYTARLVAYMLILAGVIDKNRRAPTK